MDLKEVKLLMVGLDNAGKTKLHYTLKNGSADEVIRTIGYNVETIEHNGTKYTIWEIGGHKKVRVLRNFYTEGSAAVIYVVDASAGDRFEEAKHDLHDLMQKNDISDAVLLVVANKMDLVPEFNVDSLAEYLSLPVLKQKWQILGVSAAEGGDGLYKIFDIIESMLNRTKDD